AQPFVDSHASALTLQIKKEHRKGRVLLDVYRNRPSQTIVAAYSVRGLPGAPVSTPLHWEELESLESPKALNLHVVPRRVLQDGDPWEAIAAYATPIHTEKKLTASATPVDPSRTESGGEGGRGKARTHKTPEQLEAYSRKR